MFRKRKSTFVYPHIPSAIRPVSHGERLPVLELPENLSMDFDENSSVSSNNVQEQPLTSRDADYLTSADSSNRKMTQGLITERLSSQYHQRSSLVLLVCSFGLRSSKMSCFLQDLSHGYVDIQIDISGFMETLGMGLELTW